MSGRIKILALVIGIFLTPIMLFGQLEIDEIEGSCSSFYNFYSNNRLSSVASGRGYSGIADQGDLSLGIINPASMELSRTWQIYYELSDKETMKFEEYEQCVSFDKYKDSKVFGIGLRKFGFNLGILYYQKSSYEYSTCFHCYFNGHLVDSLTYNLKNLVTYLTIPINYTVKDWLTIGASLQIEKYESRDPYPVWGQNGITEILLGKVDEQIVRPKLGFQVSPVEGFTAGATYLFEAKKEITKDYGAYYGEVIFRENPFPMQLGAGLKYSLPFAPVSVLADYNYSKDSVYDYLKDRHDYNVGLEYTWKHTLTLRSGFFTQTDYRDLNATHEGTDNSYWDDTVSYDQDFLTFGMTYRWRGFQFNASYMDSGLMKAGDIEQSYLNVGIAYNI